MDHYTLLWEITVVLKLEKFLNLVPSPSFVGCLLLTFLNMSVQFSVKCSFVLLFSFVVVFHVQ